MLSKFLCWSCDSTCGVGYSLFASVYTWNKIDVGLHAFSYSMKSMNAFTYSWRTWDRLIWYHPPPPPLFVLSKFLCWLCDAGWICENDIDISFSLPAPNSAVFAFALATTKRTIIWWNSASPPYTPSIIPHPLHIFCVFRVLCWLCDADGTSDIAEFLFEC